MGLSGQQLNVVLHYIRERSRTMVAASLGISIETVRTYIERARKTADADSLLHLAMLIVARAARLERSESESEPPESACPPRRGLVAFGQRATLKSVSATRR